MTSPRPFRLTPQRAAVLRAVHDASDHPTARDIFARVKPGLPGIGFATVYRTLNLLVEHGEVRELRVGEDPVGRYDGDTGRHDHVRCAGCGAVADVTVPLPDTVQGDAAAASGFRVDGYELVFVGRCPGCAGERL
ncbi:MAG: transcriptional repressor [Euzebyaceae bacterium]|nr:transcriptional repressor [Euzebyaceae bacterium]